MHTEYILLSFVVLFLLGYLVYTIAYPEKF